MFFSQREGLLQVKEQFLLWQALRGPTEIPIHRARPRRQSLSTTRGTHRLSQLHDFERRHRSRHDGKDGGADEETQLPGFHYPGPIQGYHDALLVRQPTAHFPTPRVDGVSLHDRY